MSARISNWLSRLFRKPTPGPLDGFKDATGLVNEFNRERQARGLAPVEEVPMLSKEAQGWAEKMHAMGKLSHIGFYARLKHAGYDDGGEVIASGQSSAFETVRSWMGSQGHRHIIVGAWQFVGVGRSGDYWCGIFAEENR